MQPTIRQSLSRTGARWALGSLLGLGALFAQTASASALGDAIRQLGASDGLQRSVTLKELGIVDPVVLAGTATQDFYLPVPRGLPLGDASIAFDSRYLKGEPGVSTVVISLNGTPAVSQTVPDGDGTLQRTLPVAQQARASDFVRLGVNWRSRNGQVRCDDNHSLANSLTISPQTRLSYRVDPRDVRSIEDVWNTLPVRTTVLVAGRQLEQASFDSAWRIGASLQRNNRRMTVNALPAVGETLDLRGLEVPAALAGVPAFAALRGAEPQHKLASDAELGALLMLGAAQVSWPTRHCSSASPPPSRPCRPSWRPTPMRARPCSNGAPGARRWPTRRWPRSSCAPCPWAARWCWPWPPTRVRAWPACRRPPCSACWSATT